LFSCYQLLLFSVYLVFEGVAEAPSVLNPLGEVLALAGL